MDRGRLNAAFGHELRTRREDAGLTIKQTYTALGWRRSTYLRSEAGERDMSPADIFEVAELFGISSTTFWQAAKKRWETGDYPTPVAETVWREILDL